jgi:hypothetical protein
MQGSRTHRDQPRSTVETVSRSGYGSVVRRLVQGRKGVSLVFGLWFIILTLMRCAHIQSIVNIPLIDCAKAILLR